MKKYDQDFMKQEKGGGIPCQKRVKRHEFIEKEKQNHSIGRMCRAMKISEDAFMCGGLAKLTNRVRKSKNWRQRSKKFSIFTDGDMGHVESVPN